jgi:hypothetical protein
MKKPALKRRRGTLRIFHLLRNEDVSGVSGTGRVAVGVIFPSGKAVIEWLGANSTFEIFDQLDHVEQIHGHGGKTRIVFTGGEQAWQAPTSFARPAAGK